MILLAQLNIEKGNWEFSLEEGKPTVVHLRIGFTSYQKITFFHNLSFGFSFVVDNQILSTDGYPKSNAKIIQTNQEFIVQKDITVRSDDNSVLAIWAENSGQRYDGAYSFVVPRPIKPYISWSWNQENRVWQSPIPKPNNEKSYSWDETNQIWFEIEDV